MNRNFNTNLSKFLVLAGAIIFAWLVKNELFPQPIQILERMPSSTPSEIEAYNIFISMFYRPPCYSPFPGDEVKIANYNYFLDNQYINDQQDELVIPRSPLNIPTNQLLLHQAICNQGQVNFYRLRYSRGTGEVMLKKRRVGTRIDLSKTVVFKGYPLPDDDNKCVYVGFAVNPSENEQKDLYEKKGNHFYVTENVSVFTMENTDPYLSLLPVQIINENK